MPMPAILSGMIVETTTTILENGTTVLAIQGVLNLGNSLMGIERAVEDLIQTGVRRLIVDLSKLQRIDSSGIGMLVASCGRMERAGGRFRVSGGAGVVAEAFKVTHINRVVPIDPDLETACVAIDSGAESRTAGA